MIEVLRAAGTRFVAIQGASDAEGVAAKITATAAVLGHEAAGKSLVARVRADLALAAAAVAVVAATTRLLFILSLQGGAVLAGGSGSSAEGIILLDGAVNAAAGFAGYKPMMDEAVLAADPQAILVMDREGDWSITPAMIRAHTALDQTQAALQGRIIGMDGMFLLGFGPRTGQAALALHDAFYGATG